MGQFRKESWKCRDANGNINWNCPHEKSKKFNDWIRLSCPDSKTGYFVTDLDFVLYNKNSKKIMLIEVKTKYGFVKPWQKTIFNILDTALKHFPTKLFNINYLGFHLIKFENTDFEDGKCYLNHKEITEAELIDFLSF